MKPLSSSDIVSTVKRSGALPTSDNTFSSSDILAFANEVISNELVPMMLSLHEQFFVYTSSSTINSTQNVYLTPYRAIGGKLLKVSYIDSSSYANEYKMVQISETQSVISGNHSQLVNSSVPMYYYLRGPELIISTSNSINLAPGTLNFVYFMQPSNLVDSSRVAQITNINTSTGDITLNKIPSAFTGNVSFDFIQQTSPHRIIYVDQTINSINTLTKVINVPTSIFSVNKTLSVGDYVALPQETIYPQLPSDIHPILCEMVVERCQRSLGLLQEAAMTRSHIDKLVMAAGNSLDNRVETSNKKVILSKSLIGGNSRQRRRWL